MGSGEVGGGGEKKKRKRNEVIRRTVNRRKLGFTGDDYRTSGCQHR